jgi:hypothetical protein
VQYVVDLFHGFGSLFCAKLWLENQMAEQTGSGASLADFIWKNAEDLWGDFKHTDFGKIILPFTLLRRLGVRTGADPRRRS